MAYPGHLQISRLAGALHGGRRVIRLCPPLADFPSFLEVSHSAREAFAPTSCGSTILREAVFFFLFF